MPVQYLLGISCIVLGVFIDDWLFRGDEFTISPTTNAHNDSVIDIPQWAPVPKTQMILLICSFTFTIFLAATQDIAVDGWAISLLSRENVGLFSISYPFCPFMILPLGHGASPWSSPPGTEDISQTI